MNLRLASSLAVVLFPLLSWAHGEGSHPADPALHIDASVPDCAVSFSPQLTQAAFGRFTREFGATSAFKQASPSTTLGQWGFAVDVSRFYFTVDEKADAWNDTFVHPDAFHELGAKKDFPKLRARLGVLENLDVGLYYTMNPYALYGWAGVEAKYGLLQQSQAMPASVSLRGAYTKTLFVKDMDMHALSADATVARTFWGILTPYVGVGGDGVLARETSANVDLGTELQVAPHLTGGLEIRYWHVAVGAEVQLATISSFAVQLSGVF